MKKRLISLALTLALCLGLAVPALASDDYGPYTITGVYDGSAYTISFSAAKVEKKTVQIREHEDMDDSYSPYQSVTKTVVTIRPDTKVTVTGGVSIYEQDKYGVPSGVGNVDGNGKYSEWIGGVQWCIYSGKGKESFNWGTGSTWDYADLGEYLIVEDDSATSAPSGGFTDVKAGAYYADAVKWAVDKKITSGTSATTFSPDQTCTVAQILTFLWNANGRPEPTVRNPFSNVSSDNYYCKAVVWAYEKGLIPGAGYFYNENVACTRNMVAYFLWKLAGAPTSVPSGQYTAQNITVVDGDGYEYYLKFDAAVLEEATVTKEVPVYAVDGPYIADWRDERAKVTLITMRPGSTVTVSNTLPSDWDMDNIILDYYGYTIGGNSKYHDMALQFPLSVCTGAVENTFQYSEGSMHELADLTAMELKNKGDNTHGSYMLQMAPIQTKFSDVPAHAFYAQAVAWAVENGITAGTSDTTFSPSDTCTRGQIVTFLHRAMG